MIRYFPNNQTVNSLGVGTPASGIAGDTLVNNKLTVNGQTVFGQMNQGSYAFIPGAMGYQASQGLIIATKTGSSFDFAIINPANNAYLAYVATGTPNWTFPGQVTSAQFNGSGLGLTNIPLASITGAGTMASQNASSVAITGGSISGTLVASSQVSTGQGSIVKDAAAGLWIRAIAGTAYDFAIANPAATSYIATVTTGTSNISFSGQVSAAQFNGSGAGLTGTAASLSIGGSALTATQNVSSLGVASPYTTTAGPSGISTVEALNNGYPTTYGNVLTINGGGANQLMLGWPSTTGAVAENYVRSLRDVAQGTNGWSVWSKIMTDANIGSYAPSPTGAGASGTWGINITGNAATATTATNQSGGSVNATTVNSSLDMNSASRVIAAASGVSIPATAAGDIFAARSGGTTGVIFLGSSSGRYLYYDGTNYQMPGADLYVNSSKTVTLAQEPSSLAANGYQKLASGLIIQWGEIGIGTNGTVTFPIAFPNAVFSVVATGDTAAANPVAECANKTTTNFLLVSNVAIVYNFQWIAIGY